MEQLVNSDKERMITHNVVLNTCTRQYVSRLPRCLLEDLAWLFSVEIHSAILSLCCLSPPLKEVEQIYGRNGGDWGGYVDEYSKIEQ